MGGRTHTKKSRRGKGLGRSADKKGGGYKGGKPSSSTTSSDESSGDMVSAIMQCTVRTLYIHMRV